MIYTDALQTIIMVVGAVILTIKGESLWAVVGLTPASLLRSGCCPFGTQVSALRGEDGSHSHEAISWPSLPSLPSLGDGGCLLLFCPCCSAAFLSPAPGQLGSGSELTKEPRAGRISPAQGLRVRWGPEMMCGHKIRRPQNCWGIHSNRLE